MSLRMSLLTCTNETLAYAQAMSLRMSLLTCTNETLAYTQAMSLQPPFFL